MTIGQTDVGTQVIDGFAFAVTGRALNLSALIVLLMLRDLAVVTNAIVLREITQHSVLGSRTGAWGGLCKRCYAAQYWRKHHDPERPTWGHAAATKPSTWYPEYQ